MNSKFKKLAIVPLMLVMLFAASACLDPRIGFQGRLTDTGGSPVPDGAYDVTVRFWTEKDGGTNVFTETKQVDVTDGLFDMDIDDFPPHLFSDVQDNGLTAEDEDTLYAEIEIEGEKLSPRQKIPGAAYATALVAGSGVIGQREDEANVTDGGYDSALTVINTQPAYANPGYGLTALAGDAGLYVGNRAGDGTASFLESVNPEDNPDIILGGYYASDISGTPAVDKGGGPGVIASDPAFDLSDIYLRSNDEAYIFKSYDPSASSSFRVYDDRTDVQLNLDSTGNLAIDGVYTAGGADYAELIDVEGTEDAYEPGDVLVISDEVDRAVELSAAPNSTRVIGVYSTDPGFVAGTDTPEEQIAREERVLAEAGVEEGSELSAAQIQLIETSDGKIEVAIAGIVPVKVTDENGPIQRGDLLTTSSTPGVAMKATNPQIGTVLGKAMGVLESGTGVIEVLIMLQ
jgi:hypothetical protein